MRDRDHLGAEFEEHRSRLRAVAYRMLGSMSEADDAVQEAWLKLDRAGAAGVHNLGAWLTTVVSRVCLDMLPSRERRREEPLDSSAPGSTTLRESAGDPEEESVLADSVGMAMLVVLDALTPAERVAFVLHDMFAVPFDEIAPMIERSPAAARQLASRARRQVKADPSSVTADVLLQRRVVNAYRAAARDGDFGALVELLDPDVVLRADAAAVPGAAGRGPTVLRGLEAVSRGATAAAARARVSEPALVNGTVGLIMAPHGRLSVVLAFALKGDKITEIDVIADPDRLRDLELAVLDE